MANKFDITGTVANTDLLINDGLQHAVLYVTPTADTQKIPVRLDSWEMTANLKKGDNVHVTGKIEMVAGNYLRLIATEINKEV